MPCEWDMVLCCLLDGLSTYEYECSVTWLVVGEHPGWDQLNVIRQVIYL